ncbi:DUF3187 family protein [Geopsychrobacter electrodiphilus]|uniref:DUF3187 family protein n=1 Tax=Geopsychrobacter electrodiphilus TaxID=225196 RepID=UPI0003A7C858|nr:DUF3187 family protein [Geopsychrobacter electrodiphilus]
MRYRLFVLISLILVSAPVMAAGFEMQPLTTRNLSPVALGFGIPALGPARVLASGAGRVETTVDLISNFTEKASAGESLRFDGETYRAALSVDYGVGSNLEFGAELPLISNQGGFLDDFIEGWHNAFGLPQGGRNHAPTGRLDYSYTRPESGFALQSDQSGIGDLSLRAAWQCWQDTEKLRSVALRTSLKLPTGRARDLTGSGSTDLALWLSGEQRFKAATGPLTLYGGGGALFTTDGDLLPDQRRNLAGLVNLGVAWQPWAQLGLQLQFDGHTPLFKESQFPELNKFAGQLAIGGSLALADKTALELAVIEDVLVNTAPDVVFHLALIHQF